MSITPPPPPPNASASYCGRCGAPFTSGRAVCERCGNPVYAPPPAATGYSYPVVAARSVPAMQHKLSHRRLWLVTGAVVGVLAIVITVIAVSVQPRTKPCGYFCGPHAGPRLAGSSTYTSSRFGVAIEYSGRDLKIGAQDDSSVVFTPLTGDGSPANGEIDFLISSGTDVDGAVRNAIGNLPTSSFQDMQENGPVRGAEIGLVSGHGTAFTATHVPADGGQSTQVGIVVMAATQGNVTVVTTMFSDLTKDVAAAPYGLAQGQTFDFPITNTRFPGG